MKNIESRKKQANQKRRWASNLFTFYPKDLHTYARIDRRECMSISVSYIPPPPFFLSLPYSLSLFMAPVFRIHLRCCSVPVHERVAFLERACHLSPVTPICHVTHQAEVSLALWRPVLQLPLEDVLFTPALAKVKSPKSIPS